MQGTLLRATIHLVSAADYWPFAIAVRAARRGWWRRVQAQGLTEADLEAPIERLRARLADGPVTQAELDDAVGRPPVPAIGLWVDLVRVPPSGTWERRRADRYASAEAWLGPPDIDAAVAQEHLVRRYLHGFGPARPADVAGWAGLPARETQAVLDRLALRRFRDEAGQLLVDVPRAPAPGRRHRGARPLPGHLGRQPARPRPGQGRAVGRAATGVFSNRNPQSVPTVLVDGAVAATWRYDGDAVRVDPLRRLHRPEAKAVDEEAERLTAFHRDG